MLKRSTSLLCICVRLVQLSNHKPSHDYVIKEVYQTCGIKGLMKGSLSGLIIKRPSSSAAAQFQALTEELRIPKTAWTACFSLFAEEWWMSHVKLEIEKQVKMHSGRRIQVYTNSHLILMYDCLDELKIRRSIKCARFTMVSSEFVTSSSSSANKRISKSILAIIYWSQEKGIYQRRITHSTCPYRSYDR